MDYAHLAALVAEQAEQADAAWTWEATATIIQAVATVVALIGVGVTFLYSARAEKRERAKAHVDAEAQRMEAERTAAAAERSERAAALSIDTLARIADAVEAVARKEWGAQGILPPMHGRVRWSIQALSYAQYLLVNEGDSTAYNVRLITDPTLDLEDVGEGKVVRPGDAIPFLAVMTYDTRDRTLTVEWSASDEDDAARDQWRYPLPMGPA